MGKEINNSSKILDIYQLTKKVLTEDKVKYPAKAAYENFLKFNADKWLSPKGCRLHYDSFGISVIPSFFDKEQHLGLILKTYKKDKNYHVLVNESKLLPHQVYLHDLVKTKWKFEKEGFEAIFEIIPIRDNEIITIS